jgi:hypothetical protein
MPFGSLFYFVLRGSVKSSLYIKKGNKGKILVFDSNFYVCYHIVQYGFSGSTYLVGMLVSVQRISLSAPSLMLSIH